MEYLSHRYIWGWLVIFNTNLFTHLLAMRFIYDPRSMSESILNFFTWILRWKSCILFSYISFLLVLIYLLWIATQVISSSTLKLSSIGPLLVIIAFFFLEFFFFLYGFFSRWSFQNLSSIWSSLLYCEQYPLSSFFLVVSILFFPCCLSLPFS